jgi:matrixin
MFRALSRAALALAAVAVALPFTSIPASASTTYSVSHAIDPHSGRSTVVRWAPCTVTLTGTHTHYITYAVNTAGGAGRVTLVQQALRKLTAASGLRFRYVGQTSYVPHYAVIHYLSGDQYVFDAAQERARTHAELVIAWAKGSATNLLTPAEAGVGTVSWSGSFSSQLRIVQAAVVLKRGVALKAGFAPGESVGALLLHELGHAVGLNHVSTPSQIMYPTIGNWTRAYYHSGDLAGLHRVGRAAGCMHTAASALANPAAVASAAGVSVTG